MELKIKLFLPLFQGIFSSLCIGSLSFNFLLVIFKQNCSSFDFSRAFFSICPFQSISPTFLLTAISPFMPCCRALNSTHLFAFKLTIRRMDVFCFLDDWNALWDAYIGQKSISFPISCIRIISYICSSCLCFCHSGYWFSRIFCFLWL